MTAQGEGIIYIATHAPTGRQYVGQTKQSLRLRLMGHQNQARRMYFSNALDKYGFDQFLFQFIPCPVENLSDMERSLISELGTRKPNGFNLTDGGDGVCGMVHSEESRRKLSQTSTGKKHPHVGVPLSESARHKLSLANIGKTYSVETRKKIAMANLGKHLSEETKKKLAISNIGKTHSQETKQKISISNIGKHAMSEEGKRHLSELHKGRPFAMGINV